MHPSMPRRAQNPKHPLTRLRRQLSTPDHQVTREELAQRTGIPLGSIKGMESGRFGITTQIASKISLGVPVNPVDLFLGADPLRDFTGKPVSADSVKLEKLRTPCLSERAGFETDQYVERIAFAVAEKKFMAIQLRFLMREAFAEVLESLGLVPLVAQELCEHLGEFDPAKVLYQLRPQQGAQAKRWSDFERLVRLEQDRLWIKKQEQESVYRLRLSLESPNFEEDLWAQALANVVASMKKDAAPSIEKSTPSAA
jgi:hypothetical protein